MTDDWRVDAIMECGKRRVTEHVATTAPKDSSQDAWVCVRDREVVGGPASSSVIAMKLAFAGMFSDWTLEEVGVSEIKFMLELTGVQTVIRHSDWRAEQQNLLECAVSS